MNILIKYCAFCKQNKRFKNEYAKFCLDCVNKRIPFNKGIRCNISWRIHTAIKKNSKYGKTMELLGCSIEFLKEYLEKQFVRGMSWENHGYYGWHIDHIRPCASFDLTKPEEQKKCFHYTNLQPLWAKDNMRKGSSTQ